MAINKKLIHFDMTKQLFMSNANGLNNLTKPTNGIVGNIPYYSVVFLKDGYIWTHGHFINGTGIADSVSSNATISWSKITDKPSTFTPSAHTQSYTTLTGSGTTANQAIVSSGTANGWVLKTLGSRAFDSTSYLPLAGGTLTGNLAFSGDNSITWSRNTDYAKIHFKNTGDGDSDSYLGFETADNGNEYFRFGHTSGTYTEWMSIKSDGVRVKGTKVSLEGHTHSYLPLSGGTLTGNLILKGDTTDNMTYSGNIHPYIRFDNSDSSQNVSLIFTDYDSYRSPAGLKLVGNQGNEWFEAPVIYQNGTKVSVEGHTHDYITSLGVKAASDLSSTYPDGLSTAGIRNNGYPFDYGGTITARATGGAFQIAGQWNAAVSSLTDPDHPTEMYIRGRRDSYDVWTTWTRVLTNRNWSSVITLPTKSSWNYDDRYSFSHQPYSATFAFNIAHNSNYVTFDGAQLAGAPNTGWFNGFVSTHNNYLSSYLINSHRTSDWYVGYSENKTAPTWYKLIHSGNIGSQSVNYATSAGNGYSKVSYTTPKLNGSWVKIGTIINPGTTYIWLSSSGTPSNNIIGVKHGYTAGWSKEIIVFSLGHTNYLAMKKVRAVCEANNGSALCIEIYVESSEATTGHNLVVYYNKENFTPVTSYTVGTSSTNAYSVDLHYNSIGTIYANLIGEASTATKATQDSDGNQINTTYLKRSGGTMTGTPYISMPSSAAAISDSQPFGITYGRIQGYSNIVIAADTDRSASEYAIITSGYDVANATKANGLAIGHNTLTWKNNTVWHAGNDGSGSGLDADLLDGKHASAFSLDGHNHDGRYLRDIGTVGTGSTLFDVNVDPGVGTITYDPIAANMGTAAENNPNVTALNLGNSFARRKQLLFMWDDDNIYYRRHRDSTWTTKVKLLHTGNTYWGTTSSNTSPLTINGTTKTVSLSGHTHNMNDIKWPGGHNLITSATANGQEWSIDCTPGTYTGTYWQVWRAATSGIAVSGTMLKVDCDTGKVSAPYGFVGNLSGNADTATNANYLISNTRMDYGWNGINYFNLSAANQSKAKVNDTPYSTAVWTHILRFNHGNNAGYYTDLAIPFNGNGIYYKRIANGSLQNSTINGGWISVLDNLNSSVSKSGETLTVKINGTSQSLTNTWRGIQNNLTSSSTTDSLSAYQGHLLANGSARDNTKLPLSGGTLTGTLSFSNNIGISGIMGGGSDGWGIVGTGEGDNGRLKIYVTDNATSDWLDFEFRDWEGTIYTPLSMTGNQIIFNYNPTVNGHSLIHTGNLPAYPTKSSWNYDDRYVASVSISGNNLRINKNGSNSDLTIPYATSAGNSDTLDGYHASSFSHTWNCNGGKYTKFMTFTRPTEKGWMRLSCTISDNSGQKGGEYLIAWGYDATNTDKGIIIKCLYSYRQHADTSLYAVRVEGSKFDLVYVSGSTGAYKLGFTLHGYSIDVTINNYTIVTYTDDTKPTATYTSDAESLITNISGNASTATKLQTSRTIWGKSFDGSANIDGILTGWTGCATNTTDTWSDGTNAHPWYGVDHRYQNTGVYSTTISDFFGLTLRTANGNLSIASNGNIGVGTYSPSYKLDVNGTLHANGATTLSSTLYVGDNATIAGTLGVYGTTTLKSATTIEANTYISGETFFSAVDAFRLNYGSYGVIHRNDGGSYWILLTDKNDQNGGFNSLRPFHIDFSNGTVHMDNNAIIDNLAFTQCNISMGGRVNATWGYDINSSDYYGLYFKSKNSSSTGILFNDDGNVGIGTTSPLRKLHVIGEAIFGEAGYVASQGTGSNYSGTWVGTGFMELSSPNPFIDFHGNMSTADYTSRLIQWGDKVRLKYENSNGVYSGYVLTCEGNHHNPVILGIFDLKRSGPGSKVWTLDNICGPCVFTLANNWGSDVNSNSNTYWTIPSNLLRVEINGVLGDNYTTKTTVKAAACIGTVMTRWMNNQPIVSNCSHKDWQGCSVECLCTDKAPGYSINYNSSSPGKYIYITGARPWGYDDGSNGLAMDQFRQTGNLSYLRVRFVVYGWLE